MPDKKQTIEVKGTTITIIHVNQADYISLTDMVKNFEDGLALIERWLRNKNTVEFLGIWKKINNANFNSLEFGGIMLEAGLNRFTLSVKKWVEKTNGIGLIARAGRFNSGTYAHKDIAFEFGSWLSAEFKLYMIKEFQRLKDEESSSKRLEWDFQRTLSKINYRIHTDAIKEALIPPAVTKDQIATIYATEADMLNVALFGSTAKQWREHNPGKPGNIRDEATLEQLVVLSNMESINALLLHQGLTQTERLQKLNQAAIQQMKSLLTSPTIKRLSK
ncbi:KilA-N domain-containing protein [Flavitalea sp. BT771]|uniref:KilA-N domain-containing protein n=1 Tax=Flavitalea sp. BT771 TaxID=3063329 RepID=UPI0026E2D29B|nr:KilA-N domain-containing protein [Flavitalea sp. BT771]MDO6430080.1 KilA-N domain-containing protein [Flavitalea sp. BT771]MDV6219781.1 KilA-N domain-containing protein [Flavitalea sp. BT771]